MKTNVSFSATIAGVVALLAIGICFSDDRPGSKPAPQRRDPVAKETNRDQPAPVATPVYTLGGPTVGATNEDPPPPPYEGTKIVPDTQSQGVLLDIQERFAEAMSRQDPLPQGRADHFHWLSEHEYLQQGQVRPIGWYGVVVDTRGGPDGGYLVKVRIKPWLYSHRYKTLLVDYVIETYQFSSGRIRLIDSDCDTPRPELKIFPTHR